MKTLLALLTIVVAAVLAPSAMSTDRGTLTTHSSRFGRLVARPNGTLVR